MGGKASGSQPPAKRVKKDKKDKKDKEKKQKTKDDSAEDKMDKLMEMMQGLSTTVHGHRSNQNDTVKKTTKKIKQIQEQDVTMKKMVETHGRQIEELQANMVIMNRFKTRAVWGPDSLRKKIKDEKDGKKRTKLFTEWFVKNSKMDLRKLPKLDLLRASARDKGPIVIAGLTDDLYWVILKLDEMKMEINKGLRNSGGTETKDDKESPKWSYGSNQPKTSRTRLEEARKAIKWDEDKNTREVFESLEDLDELSDYEGSDVGESAASDSSSSEEEEEEKMDAEE